MFRGATNRYRAKTTCEMYCQLDIKQRGNTFLNNIERSIRAIPLIAKDFRVFITSSRSNGSTTYLRNIIAVEVETLSLRETDCQDFPEL